MTHTKIAHLTINEMPSHLIKWRLTQFDGNIYISQNWKLCDVNQNFSGCSPANAKTKFLRLRHSDWSGTRAGKFINIIIPNLFQLCPPLWELVPSHLSPYLTKKTEGLRKWYPSSWVRGFILYLEDKRVGTWMKIELGVCCMSPLLQQVYQS